MQTLSEMPSWEAVKSDEVDPEGYGCLEIMEEPTRRYTFV